MGGTTTSRVIEFPTISDMPEFQLGLFSAHFKKTMAHRIVDGVSSDFEFGAVF
jgi:hypothetical protein